MEQYWNTRIKPTAPTNPTDDITDPEEDSILSEFDRHRLTLIANQTEDEGWQSEKARYLKDLPTNITKETDIVEWWQVCLIIELIFNHLANYNVLQNNGEL